MNIREHIQYQAHDLIVNKYKIITSLTTNPFENASLQKYFLVLKVMWLINGYDLIEIALLFQTLPVRIVI